MNFSKFFLIAIFFIGIISPLVVAAADAVAPTPVYFCGQVDIPLVGTFFKKSEPKADKSDCTKVDNGLIAKMAADTYKFIAGIAGIAAVIVMMAGGYVWLFAGGNASKVGEAKSLIGSAVLGLFLVLGSYMILNLINPRLVELKSLKVRTIKKISISENGSTSNDINAATYLCPPDQEEKAREKTKVIDGCGKLMSAKETGGTSCMRVSCPAGQVCVLNKSGGDYLAGEGGCQSTISAVRNDEPKTFSTKYDTVADCGSINTDGTAVFSNNCGGDEKYTSCTLTRIDGEDPEVAMSGDGWLDLFKATYKRVENMQCQGDL